MGNDLSKPRVAAPDTAGCDPHNIETTDHVSQRQPEPIPTWTPPATQTPLTPPPSAGLKRPGTPEHTLNHPQRILTPPTSTNPPTPSLSPTLLGTPASHLSSFQTLCADLDFCSPTTTTTTTDTPCSHCYRPIPSPQQRPLPHQQESSPQPTALRCGHILCRQCLRAVLLLSLSTDPFVPATCPACRGAAAAAALEDGMDYSAGKDAHDDTTTTTEETGSQQKKSESQPTSSSLSSIPLAVLGQAATSPEFLAYQLKLREHHTPPEKRLYCHDRERCGMFLGGLAKPWIRARVSVCPLCGARTCKVCGGKAHQAGIRRKDGGKEGEGDVGGCERDGKEKTKGGERKVVSPAVRRRRKMAWRRGRGEMERREQMCPGRVCQGVA
ncbi:hypothetical protein VTJ04DRAFT_2867 [Mycothermus thermophilus]|uniref:uncharacterized protein n=1 Tax=Humicola insolens TaxID=85995 RepID=UPI0037442945